jgi:hypothetical protein
MDLVEGKGSEQTFLKRKDINGKQILENCTTFLMFRKIKIKSIMTYATH